MQGFIKRRSDFKTIALLDVIDYDITLASIYDENSSFKVAGEVALNQGDFLFFEGHGWIIERSDPAEGMTQITCVDLVNLFSRSIVYTVGTDIETFIQDGIEDNFSGSGDTVFDMPYIVVTVATTTTFIAPEVKDGVYSLKSYIALARRLSGVYVSFAVAGSTLSVSIEARSAVSRKIDFLDDAHKILAESYSASSVAKITAMELVGDTVTLVRDFYLMADGSVTETPVGTRATGDWVAITTTTNGDDTAVKVADDFAKNSYSHLIEFESSKVYGFYDRLQVRIRGRVLSSYISAIRKSSKSNRTLYKSGELRLTLTDKLKEMI